MEVQVYKDVANSESGWWYLGRTYALTSIVPRFLKTKGSVLDVGSGFGSMFSFLAHFGDVYAHDTYPDCIAACKKRGYKAVFSDLEEVTANNVTYSLIGAFDALEHIEDDKSVLQQLRSKLGPDGLFVATVPAHPFLYGSYDRAAHHVRRYSATALRNLFTESGYEIVYMSYWNALLFFPAAIARLLGSGGTQALVLNPLVDGMFQVIVYVESLLLRVIRLPFGLSLVVVARKKR
jgi:SAM-dependent methyltransferase